MDDRKAGRQPAIDGYGALIGLAVGLPVVVAVGALMATARPLFSSTNAALVLMIVVVVMAVIGGRTAGIITALCAVLSFDFFHTEPYLSLRINSRDDVETTILLLIAGLIAGTVATAGRSARRRAGVASTEIRRIHRVAEAAVSGRPADEVIHVAQDELCSLLRLERCRFEVAVLPPFPRLGRSGALQPLPHVSYAATNDGRSGFELPRDGVELPVLVRGQQIGRFVLLPTPGEGTTLEERMVAVAIADQVGAVLTPAPQDGVTRS